ncbi:MAG: hypothetical protein IT435_08705 [Phycisphaerales bacterium]|nr:hypothetical protein [Phycisphaerales bacterium]
MLEAILTFFADIIGYWLYQVYLDSEHGTTRKIFAAIGTLVVIGFIIAFIYYMWIK